jgi:uncharacterized protein (DUF849 family)
MTVDATIEPWVPLIVTVAPNGARKGKSDHAALPMTTEEIARCAAECRERGAAMIHLHVRDSRGGHSLDADIYSETIDAVRAAAGPDMVIQMTTEAVGVYDAAQQMQAVRAVRPEAVSLGLREFVPMDDTTDDDTAVRDFADFLAWLRAERIFPQYILYTAEDVVWFLDYCRRGVIPGDRHFLLFVLGRYSKTQQSDPADLLPFLAALGDAPHAWAVCAFGARENACAVTAAGLGGHVRVGFENNMHLADGSLAADNGALVGQVTETMPSLGRPVATPSQARAFMSALVA